MISIASHSQCEPLIISDLVDEEIDAVNGAKLSAAEVTAYTLLGVAAIATGGVGCVVAGSFLLTMTAALA